MADDVKLTEREMAIARKAAEIAVEMATDTMYKQIGKSVVTRIFVWVGVVVLGIGAANGWIKWPNH